ncbi:MAG: PAS domain-containing protein [Planctomycetaceae bacterium]|nr:PAS domain-containing protein [Planctomycetaceae bacterium]
MNAHHFPNFPPDFATIPALSGVIDSVARLPGAVLFTTDADGNYTFLTGPGLEYLEIVPEEWLGRSIFEYLKDQPEQQAIIWRVFHGETVSTKSLFGKHLFENHLCPVCDSEGKMLGISGVQFHITEQSEVEIHFQNLTFLENLFDSIPEIAHVLDRDFKIRMANRASRNTFTEVPILGNTCYRMISGFEQPCPWCPVIKMYQTGLPEQTEFFDDLRNRYQRLNCFPIRDPQGNIIGAMEMATEVTEQRLAQDALQKSEALLQDLFSSISDGIFVIDREYTILRTNTAMEKMYPDHAPLVGKKCYEKSLHKCICPNCAAEKMFELKKPITAECYEQPTDGRPEMWFDHTAYPIFNKETGDVTGAISVVRDVTERKQIELELQKYRTELESLVERRTRELQLSEAKLRSILETCPAAIAFLDRQGNFTYVNKAYEELFGFSEDELYGKFAFLYSAGTDEEHQRFWNILKGKTDYSRVTTRLYTKEKQTIWCDISASAVRGMNPADTLLIAVIVDVTQQQRIFEELQRAKEAAEEASQAKSQFLATMSHEIRTPLNGVIGISDLLMETPLRPKQLEYAQLIKTSGESLLFLINDILDFSKIESGKFELEASEFVIHDLIESILGILASKADEKQLDLIATFDNRVPGPVVGDKGRLRQILLNLVGNALKFTETGGVRIHIGLAELFEDRIRLEFSVADTGIGIAKERQNRLFQTFSQVDASSARSYGGTGLGLAISKKLVELMDGDIGVESTKGEGATFWFTACFKCHPIVQKCLKAAVHPCITEKRDYCRGTPPQRCARSGREVAYLQRVAELKGLKVLFVGMGPFKVSTLTEQMQSWEMCAQAVAAPEDTLQCLEENLENPFQLVIINFLSNDSVAESLARSIQEEERFREIRMIFLSPLSEDLHRKFWKYPEKIRCVSKPICSSKLLDSIVRSFYDLPELPEIVSNGKALLNQVDRQSIRVLVAEDNQINRVVITEILKKFGMDCIVVENGELAVENVKNTSFHVVLMDCQMPVMDGYDATRKIRQWEEDSSRSSRIPIIALTANATSEDEAKCLAVGMDAYCSKPVNAGKLLDLIHEQLEVISDK